MIFIVLALVFVGILIVIPVLIYNSLIGKKNQVENVAASLDALLKKRFDLIPNLVAGVQQYMKHERETLTAVTGMRTRGMEATSDHEKVELDRALTGALRGLMVSVENYPDLKASQNFLQLQGSLNETEEQISAGRRAFNASVTDLNNAIEMFPTNIFAGMMSLKKRELYAIPEEERKNVDVKKLFNS